MTTIAAATFEELQQATLDEQILAAFSDPVDLDACERAMDVMRSRHRMTYDECVARVGRLVPAADYEAIAYEIDSTGHGDEAQG